MIKAMTKDKHKAFPWYDSPWLQAYIDAKAIIRRVKPGAMSEFDTAMATLQAAPGFQVRHLKQVLDNAVYQRIKHIIAGLDQSELEQHEFYNFGRFVLHAQPSCTASGVIDRGCACGAGAAMEERRRLSRAARRTSWGRRGRASGDWPKQPHAAPRRL